MPQKTLLIVEDHGPTRSALHRYFAGRGWDVDEAGTVGEALAVLEYGPEPTLLILDLMLLDGPGEAVLAWVRSSRLRTFVVVASACRDGGRLRQVARLGPNCLLPKPYDLEALCKACTAHLEGREAARWESAVARSAVVSGSPAS